MLTNLCNYKELLGIPGQGIHKHYFGFAVADLIFTIIIAFIIMLLIKKYTNNTMSHSMIFAIILFILVLIAEYFHKLFCIYQ